MKNKLIPMTDFVLEQYEQYDKSDISQETAFNNTFSYARFLKEPLKLEMFVPCDDEDNVLEKPYNYFDGHAVMIYELDFTKWQQAKDKVLFDHQFTYDTKGSPSICFNNRFQIINGLTIESIVKYDLTLTPTAMKMIYGTDI